MSQQSGVSQLVQHLQGLMSELTALEKLGLLSDTGKSLLLLCQKMTPTPSTAGSVANQATSGTSMSPQISGRGALENAWWNKYQEQLTRYGSLGQRNVNPKDMMLGTTRGWDDLGAL